MSVPYLLQLLVLLGLNSQVLAQEEDSGRTLYIVLIIIGLSLGGRAISSWLANRNRQKVGLPPIHGPLGGTICPNCAQPYAFHLWSFKLLLSRLDRCPRCGQWKIVKRYPPDVLEAAAEAALAVQKGKTAVSSPLTPEEQLRKKLDDSRFDEN